jgi:ankyrin repeat protein
MDTSPWNSRKDGEAFLQAYACDNPSGDNILHLAVRREDLDLTRRLLEAKFPVDMKNDNGQTPLHLVAEIGSLDIGRLLVAFGADVLERQSLPETIPHDKKSDSDSNVGPDAEYPLGDDDATSGVKLKSLQQKPPSPFDIAFDKGHDNLLKIFVKNSLPIEMSHMREWTMLSFMAKAFVEHREGVLEAFHEIGWGLSRQHSRIRRSFLHYVAEQAEDVGPVELLLNSGSDARAKDIGGATVLHIAAQLGRCSDGSVVKRLISAGARVGAKDMVFGGTPLSAAIQGRKIMNVRVLLEAGSDANHIVTPEDNMRRTLLHLAAQDGIPEIIQLLLDQGADPNVLDELGGTPAHWAVQNNHCEAVKILLDGGLDPNFDKGYSFRMALSLGRLKMARLFLQYGAKADERSIYTAGDRVNYKGDRVPFFELCAEHMNRGDKASSDEEDIDGNEDFRGGIRSAGLNIPSIMMSGVGVGNRHDNFRLAAVLLEHGLGGNLADLKEVARAFLMCICAERGYISGISRLLELGKVSNAIHHYSVRPFRWTALHIAAYFGNTALVEVLLVNGWSLTQEDSMGRSVLDLAVSNGNVELVQKLLTANCTVEHRDRDGNTPLYFAVSGPSGDSTLLLESLYAAGCNVSKANVAGETPLHRAAKLNYSTAAVWLLEKGATVNATDRFLNTPLHVAACYDAVPVIDALLSCGGNINQVAVDGRTPLHCASEAGSGDAVAALLDLGADTNKKNSQGRTALTSAIFSGACEPSTVDKLFAHSNVDWTGPRAGHPFVVAALAARSKNRAAVLGSVLRALKGAVGKKKARRIAQRLMPELMPEILVSADDSDRGSPADVIPLLLDFLPENGRTRHIALFHMLLCIIKHGGDDDGDLTRRILLLDESNVIQTLREKWGLQHLCCKYSRLKQLRVLLGLGMSPVRRIDIDGVSHQPVDIAKRFSPKIVGQFESLIETMSILMDLCHRDRTIFPLLRSAVGMKHFEREIIDLSAAFERDGDSN